jgi:hypothetical protein
MLIVTQLINNSSHFTEQNLIAIFTRAHKWSLILCHMNPVHMLPSYYPQIRSNITLPSTPKCSEWPLLFRFPDQNSVNITNPFHDCANVPSAKCLMNFRDIFYGTRTLEVTERIYFWAALVPRYFNSCLIKFLEQNQLIQKKKKKKEQKNSIKLKHLTYFPYKLYYISYIALGYGLGDRGFESRHGLGVFLFTTTSRPALGPTQPPIIWVPGTHSLGVNRTGHEADHSIPSSAEVKYVWIYTSTPTIRLHGVVLS